VAFEPVDRDSFEIEEAESKITEKDSLYRATIGIRQFLSF
jgi:hypothetical protein